MKRRSVIAQVAGIVTGCLGLSFSQQPDAGASLASGGAVSSLDPPHAQALALVLAQRHADIAQAEILYFKAHGTDSWRGEAADYSWHDVLERSWRVRRPIAPGLIDSTHMFSVTYVLNGTEVLRFAVDTYTRTVTA
jgi:hypothetical protein